MMKKFWEDGTAYSKLMAMLEEYKDMEDGEAKKAYWEKIQEVMGEAADELHDFSANHVPSGYILAEQLKRADEKFLAEQEKRIQRFKPPTFWQILFGRRKK